MKSTVRVASPPAQPLLIFDGDCKFCTFWIRRWQKSAAEPVDVIPFQDARAAAQFPELARAELERGVHLVEPDGSVFCGAEAVFRTRAPAYARDLESDPGWWLGWYEHSPVFARVSERAYDFVARHRQFFSALTRLGWGRDSEPPTNVLVSWLFLRCLGALYLIAFVSLWVQLPGLIGSDGIVPAQLSMEAVQEQAQRAGLGWDRYHLVPTLCWLGSSDRSLNWQCAAGTALSILLLVGLAPAPCLFLLWLIYLSLTTVGREFLSFQWDNLLLETGFLAIFLAPLRLWPRLSRSPPPSRLVLWLFRWLLFRLMFASGCVKLLSGDPAWRHLTALQFHYETQPLPTWLGWYAQQLPSSWQHLSTLVMFAIELVFPFLIFAPPRLRLVPLSGFVVLQILILLTGNYCFFNLLTIALCLLLLDDRTLRRIIPLVAAGVSPASSAASRRDSSIPVASQNQASQAPDATPAPRSADKPSAADAAKVRKPTWPRFVLAPVAAIAVVLPLMEFAGMFHVNLPWPRPFVALYGWLAPFRSLNSYGLFAVMTTTRQEIVVEGSNDGITWIAYEFKYKPGDVQRRPAFVEPHQPRLDWQMWFAALSDYRRNPWFVNFCLRLLQGSPAVLALLERDPFPHAPPRYIRAELYEYHFTDRATRRRTGAWWRRERIGEYLPAISLRPAQRQ